MIICRIRAYLAIGKLFWRTKTVFMGNLIMQGLLTSLFAWMNKQLYVVTFATCNTNNIGGFNIAQTVWLLSITQIFERSAMPPPIKIIDDEIKTGLIAYALQRPYSYILYHMSGFLGRMLASVVTSLLLTSIALVLLVGGCPCSLTSLLAGVLCLALGCVLDFFAFFILGLIGFWVEDVKPFNWLYSKAKLILGGIMIPIAFFPQAVQNVSRYLPFGYLYYTASTLIVNFDVHLFIQCLVTQLCWIALFGALAYYVFCKGVRHVAVNGG